MNIVDKISWKNLTIAFVALVVLDILIHIVTNTPITSVGLIPIK